MARIRFALAPAIVLAPIKIGMLGIFATACSTTWGPAQPAPQETSAASEEVSEANSDAKTLEIKESEIVEDTFFSNVVIPTTNPNECPNGELQLDVPLIGHTQTGSQVFEGCGSSAPTPGKELGYRFTAPDDGFYRFWLESENKYFDSVLILLDEAPDDEVETSGDTTGSTTANDEQVSQHPLFACVGQILACSDNVSVSGPERQIMGVGRDIPLPIEKTSNTPAPDPTPELSDTTFDTTSNTTFEDPADQPANFLSEVGAYLRAGDSVIVLVDSFFSEGASFTLQATRRGETQCSEHLTDLGSEFPLTANGDTTGAVNKLTSTCLGSGPDVLYSWTAPHSGSFKMTTAGSAPGHEDTLLYVRDQSCDGEELACNDDIELGEVRESEVIVDLAKGQRVVIVVDGFAQFHGPFQLQIQMP